MSDTPIATLLPRLIRTDGGTQARATLNEETVSEYLAAYESTAPMPPLTAYYDGTDYWLADGFHRLEAYKRMLTRGLVAADPEIGVEVRSGTRRDAVLFACSANADHGLRRTRADVQRAIETLLRDEEWGTWSDREIARQCRCDHKTVSSCRDRLATGGEIPHLTERRGSDGKTYSTPQPSQKPQSITPPHQINRTSSSTGAYSAFYSAS